MPTCRTDLEVALYNALRRIARDYDTAERLLRNGERSYGIPGAEVLQMAYENLQETAKCALKGVRPRAVAPATEPEGMEARMLEALPSRERCGWCREYSPVGFWVPNEVWAQVVPERFRETVSCIRCFARMADERLVEWDRNIRFFPVSLRTTLSLNGMVARQAGVEIFEDSPAPPATEAGHG